MKTIETKHAPAALGPYSQAKKVGNLVFLSGQIGINPETGKLAEGLEAQAEQVAQYRGCAEEGRRRYGSCREETCFLTDMENFAAFNEIYGKHFISKPARSCVSVLALPAGALCEVEVIAHVK